MTDDAHRAILRQIVGDARVALPSEGGHGAAPKGVHALKLEAARSVRDDFGVTAVVEACEASRPMLDALADEVTPERLSMLLRGGPDRVGLAVYTPELAMALLEWRLLGILAEEAPAPRTLTATDAAILADLTDPLLRRFGTAVSAEPGGEWAAGYAQGTPVEDPRHIPLLMAQGAYHGFRLTLRLGKAGRGGDLFLALPEAHAPAPAKAPGAEGRPWPDALKVGVLGAELVLNAVLWRTRMPAGAIGRLKPGDLLPIPLNTLAEVRIEGPGRVEVARGRLGQAHGERAVKIDGPEGAAAPMLDGGGFGAPGLAPPVPMAAGGFSGPDDAEEYEAGLPDLGAADDGGFPVAPAMAMGGFGAEDDDEEGGFAPATVDLSADFPAMS